MSRLAALVQVVSGLSFTGLGLWFFHDPVAPLAGVGGGLGSAAIQVEVHAFDCGARIGLGKVMLIRAMLENRFRPGLWLVLLVNRCTGLPRGLALLAGGPVLPFFVGRAYLGGRLALLVALALRLVR